LKERKASNCTAQKDRFQPSAGTTSYFAFLAPLCPNSVLTGDIGIVA
jgi:hypothetical protein